MICNCCKKNRKLKIYWKRQRKKTKNDAVIEQVLKPALFCILTNYKDNYIVRVLIVSMLTMEALYDDKFSSNDV